MKNGKKQVKITIQVWPGVIFWAEEASAGAAPIESAAEAILPPLNMEGPAYQRTTAVNAKKRRKIAVLTVRIVIAFLRGKRFLAVFAKPVAVQRNAAHSGVAMVKSYRLFHVVIKPGGGEDVVLKHGDSVIQLGVIAALTGQVFGAGKRVYFVLILTSLILIFGLNLVGLIEINFPVLVKKFPQSEKHNAITYPFLLGLIFAFASTPCSTPILAGIMAVASISANIVYAALMLFLFSVGQGMIILFAGLFTSVLKNLSSFARYTDILTKISGIILILFAVFLYYKVFEQFI